MGEGEMSKFWTFSPVLRQITRFFLESGWFFLKLKHPSFGPFPGYDVHSLAIRF
jgi:hypothetical protein